VLTPTTPCLRELLDDGLRWTAVAAPRVPMTSEARHEECGSGEYESAHKAPQHKVCGSRNSRRLQTKMTIFALEADTGNTCERVPVTNATACLLSIM